MVVKYVNRKGQTYYLHRGVTRAGKPRYYFSMRAEGDLAEEMPEGYEIYEHPNGQVYLRRVRPRRTTEEEVKVVEEELRRCERLRYYKVDVRGKAVVVYEPDQEVEGLKEVLSWLGRGKGEEVEGLVERLVEQMLTYTAVLRFVLVDEEEREFVAERYCFLGRVDDWIGIGGPGDLRELAKRYVRHLGRESFYELL